jgi:hypothetical protein
MAHITYFKANLKCPRCGAEGPAWIPSHLGDLGATYVVGDCPRDDIIPSEFEETSYRVRAPADGEPVHVLLGARCGNCSAASFVDVVFDDGCIRDIHPVELDPTTLDRLHYIAEDVQDMIENITGLRLYDDVGLRADWLETLRAALEAGRRW